MCISKENMLRANIESHLICTEVKNQKFKKTELETV